MAKDKSADKTGVAVFERSPSHLLRRALQISLDLFAEAAGPDAVTQRQYAVLSAAAAHDGAAQTELVAITGIDRSTLAEMIARMIDKGLLERERSATDARANAVRLTEAGRAALDEAAPKALAADARLLKLISGRRRREALVDLLDDLVSASAAPPKQPKADKKKRKKPAKP